MTAAAPCGHAHRRADHAGGRAAVGVARLGGQRGREPGRLGHRGERAGGGRGLGRVLAATGEDKRREERQYRR